MKYQRDAGSAAQVRSPHGWFAALIVSTLIGLFAPAMCAASTPTGIAPGAPGSSALAMPSVVFYYGRHPPIDVLQSFDWVVVDGDAVLPPQASGVGVRAQHPHYFGYLSVGEVRDDSRLPPPPSGCIIGQNLVWHAHILDMRQADCRDWVLRERVAPMLALGFTRFFLDTLDSYEPILHEPAQLAAYQAGIVALVEAIRARAPDAQFILNRGFSLLPQLRSQGVVGVAAESLYQGWDQQQQRYVSVSQQDRHWLRTQFQKARAEGLVPIAIDYLPSDQAHQAAADAARISADGIVPYVTNARLDWIGAGAVKAQPRTVLMLYDDSPSPRSTNVNWYAAMAFNHMGYATRELDPQRQPLPQHPLNGRVAGIVAWMTAGIGPRSEAAYDWLRQQMRAGVPVLIIGEFGFPMDAEHLDPLGLQPGSSVEAGAQKVRVTQIARDLMGFETVVHPQPDGFMPLTLREGQPVLSLQRAGQTEVAAAIMPWGGYVLSPYVINYLPQGALEKHHAQAQWVVNPFTFFRRALRLPEQQPVYDFTTLSGQRMLFSQVDGDGFTSASYIPEYREQPAGEVIYKAVLQRYHMPVAMSVIASFFAKHGLLDAAERAKYIPIARKIFALPWVEIGSHTYSHPFDWPALEADPGLSAGLHLVRNGKPAMQGGFVATAKLKYGYNLPVPGYRFNPKTEVFGSIDIINDLLAPPGKKVALYQWSGDTNPDAQVVGMTYAAGVMNINGGNSTISNQWPSLTNVGALGVWHGDYFQVYAPDANEDEFTDNWSPPYCGYDRVLQTFHRTETPRRLAAVDIYYHYYTGARPCGLKQLQTVLNWAQKQPFTPVFPSHYARVALGFEYGALARDGDAWIAQGYGDDQTLRIPKTMGWPDLARSQNVAGWADVNDDRYIALGRGKARLVFGAQRPIAPYLAAANAVLTSMTRQPDGLTLDFTGYVPLRVRLGNTSGCRVRFNGKAVIRSRGDTTQLESAAHSGRVDVACTR